VIGCGRGHRPGSLIEEMESLVQRGVVLDGNLYISKNAHLIMPYIPRLDRARSQARQAAHRTHRQGRRPRLRRQGPRVGISRWSTCSTRRLFREKVESNLAQKNRVLRDIYDAERSAWTPILHSTCANAGWLAPVHHRHRAPAQQVDRQRLLRLFEGARAPCSTSTTGRTRSSLVLDHGRRRGHRHRRPPTKIHGALGGPRLHHAGGRRAVPHRDDRKIAETIRARGNAVRLHHGTAATLRLVRRRRPALRGAHQRLDTSRSPSSTSSTSATS